MKRFICIMTTVVFLLVSVSCSPPGGDPKAAGSGISSEIPADRQQNQSAVSLKKFKSEIKERHLGKVVEVNGDYGYDAALVTADDGTNYIYMYLADPAMAKSILTDSDGDGKTDADVSLTMKGNGYELYTQESTITGSSDNDIYGRCLLAGSMIIIISGTMDNKELIRENADEFMKELGYRLA